MKPAIKLLNLTQLQDFLAESLPSRPEYRTMIRAIEAGMPFYPDPMGRDRFRLFDGQACLEWWLSAKPKKQKSGRDAALSLTRRRPA